MRFLSLCVIGIVALCAIASISLVQADLPIHCLNAQVAGDWVFTLDAGGNKPHSSGDLSGIACGYPQPDRNADHFTRPSILVGQRTLKVSLTEPNIAVDENGNKGTWTMIYDEGFEVAVGGRKFFAFNKYVPNKGTSISSDKVAHYTSHCDETMVGWYSEESADGATYGCYRGKQTKALNAFHSAISRIQDDGIDVAPVVSPTALIEEFSRVLKRDTDPDEIAARRRGDTVFIEADAEIESSEESTASIDLVNAFKSGADADADDELDLDSVAHPRSSVATEFPELDEHVVFEPDHVFIERHNRNKRNTWRAGAHKHLSKKPVKDMLQMLGMQRFNKDVTGRKAKRFTQPIIDNRPDEVKYAGLPENWDWSDRNGVSYDTEIRNQGSCGSCYAMATISALEARYRVKSHLAFRPIISPQDIVSCSFYNQGCQGGYPFLVAKHGSEFGMVDAECHPYTARNSECHSKCSTERLRMHNYSYVGGYMGGCSEVAMMREIYANGPVMVAFQAPPDLFYYTGGIYTGPAPKEEAQGVHGVNVWQQTNHAVVAVGWGVDKKSGVKYWKLKNTWGLRWGEQGYFRIRRGTNECGVESMATKADVLLPESVKIPSDAPNPWAAEKSSRDVKHKARFAQRSRARRAQVTYDD